jgi:hypothetical protein
MKRLLKKLSKIEFIVIHPSPVDQILGMSKPCANCTHRMKLFNIKTVYYSESDGSITREKVSEMTSNHISNA